MDLAGEQLLPGRRYIDSAVSWIVNEICDVAAPRPDEHDHDALPAEQPLRAFVLGNYGAGKSSVAIEAAYRALERRIETGTGRIPVYLSLRAWKSMPSWDDISRRLAQGGIYPFASHAEVEARAARHELFFLLDGLDEIAANIAHHEPIALINEVPRSLSDAPFVTFSRMSLFQEYDAVFDMVNVNANVLPAYLATGLGASRYQAVRLVEPSQRQIDQYLEAVCGPDADFAARTLRDIYDLADLARRPVLLMMIAKCMPGLRQRIASGRPVRPGDLYDLYVAQWHEHERERARLSEQDRRLMLEELALHLWSEQILRISRVGLEKYVRTRYGDAMLDAFLHDIRTCSFLDLGPEGYEFSHKSFLEYFVASAITTDLFSQHHDGGLRLSACLRNAASQNEVLDFVQDQVLARLASGTVHLSSLLDLLSAPSGEDRGRVGHILGHVAVQVRSNGEDKLAEEIRARLENAFRHETDDWALRTLAIACGRAGSPEVLNQYVTSLLPMPLHRRENLRYHLHYYGGSQRTLVWIVLHLLSPEHDFLRAVDLFTLQQIIDGEEPMTDADRRLARDRLADVIQAINADTRAIPRQDKMLAAVRNGGRSLVQKISREGATS
jgi:hypothetical protein